MSSNAPNQRRTLLVKGVGQKQLILGFSIVPLASLIFMLTVVGIFAAKLTEEAVESGAELTNLRPFFLSLIGYVFVSIVVTLYQATKHSHSIAGPMTRISETLARIQNGEKQVRLELRESDYFDEISKQINAALDSCAQRESPSAKAEETASSTSSPAE